MKLKETEGKISIQGHPLRFQEPHAMGLLEVKSFLFCPFGSSGSVDLSEGGSYGCQRIIRSKVFVGEPQVFNNGVFFNVVFMVRIQVAEVYLMIWYRLVG